MNPNEFKAWLNGFAQGIGDAPTAEQWKIVLENAQSLGSIINFQLKPERSEDQSKAEIISISANGYDEGGTFGKPGRGAGSW